ncbi:MAG: hydroxymethylbilane synthase [Coriobacteriales bacterium]|jgi:hydroxymethylbilane synthase|nr:hydroxymethylbilane synthase [Coriobacteriales bacterium]
MKTLRIGTRTSRLALWQAHWVKDCLQKHFGDASIEVVPMQTAGDRMLDVPLPEVGDKGLFTQELERALLESRIDMAVHSLKDMPTELPPGLRIGAFGKREDPRDVFLGKDGRLLEDLSPQSSVGTSSLRRAAQIRRFRPDLRCVDIRGNLDTRWRKLQETEDLCGLVLAAAGVRRLGWQEKITEYLAEDIVLPAAGQGVIAVEIAAGHDGIKDLLQAVNHPATEYEARAEREFLRALQGNCQVPIGAHAMYQDGALCLRVMVSNLDGSRMLRLEVSGLQPEEVGRQAAHEIVEKGAAKILLEAAQNG